ncbi:DegT/DnrJ/EryC1/StrS family aminotransferase [Candidatus Woesearchaeota archaeon]|nr:DegT/DnrJ/EryC1/StrS family aminotransferase [Candidatus Woesearchaeota archaeon]
MLFSQQRITPQWGDLAAAFLPQPTSALHRLVELPFHYWTGSGREALRLVLSHCRVEKEVSRIGVPTFTCQVVLDAVRRSGCVPVFYDCGVVADPADIIRVLPRVDALLITYNFGFVPEMDVIAAACKRRDVILIEDCAQALGARWNNQLVGGFGSYAVYSFGLSKNIGFCGGLIASKEKMILPRMPPLPLRHVREAVVRTIVSPFFFSSLFYDLFKPLLRDELSRKQEPLTYGYSSYARRVVLHQWRRYDRILALRRRNAILFKEKLISSVPLLRGNVHDGALYVVLLENDRAAVQRHLEKRGVEFGVMRTFRCFERGNPKASRAEQEHLTLALYRPKREVERIISILNEYYGGR